jgi:hypothetical protein
MTEASTVGVRMVAACTSQAGKPLALDLGAAGRRTAVVERASDRSATSESRGTSKPTAAWGWKHNASASLRIAS